jgi:hypothetical protein
MTTSPSEIKVKRKRTPLAHLVPSVVLMRAEGRTLEEIGARLALTKQRISQVVKAAKKFEDVSAQWGFPFSNRTHRVLDALAIQSKEDALALYRTGHLYPGAVWSFGRKSYNEICEWLGVEPLTKRPTKGCNCPHCGKPI